MEIERERDRKKKKKKKHLQRLASKQRQKKWHEQENSIEPPSIPRAKERKRMPLERLGKETEGEKRRNAKSPHHPINPLPPFQEKTSSVSHLTSHTEDEEDEDEDAAPELSTLRERTSSSPPSTPNLSISSAISSYHLPWHLRSTSPTLLSCSQISAT